LIAHSYWLVDNCIVVYDLATGAVKSARSYSSGGYDNYNRLIKSMVISSGVSPMAYVLSNFRTGSSTCTGQQLLKFDPTTITAHSSAWIKQTTGSTSNNCGHLGLTFGRGESLLYAFSWFNSLSTLSLLDLSGNSKWQYSTSGGSSTEGNLIRYKTIDSATDMAVATSGLGSSICYTRIISSASSPSYSVVNPDSKTFRDSTLGSGKRLRGLFIND
jgi:hypothetical protein